MSLPTHGWRCCLFSYLGAMVWQQKRFQILSAFTWIGMTFHLDLRKSCSLTSHGQKMLASICECHVMTVETFPAIALFPWRKWPLTLTLKCPFSPTSYGQKLLASIFGCKEIATETFPAISSHCSLPLNRNDLWPWPQNVTVHTLRTVKSCWHSYFGAVGWLQRRFQLSPAIALLPWVGMTFDLVLKMSLFTHFARSKVAGIHILGQWDDCRDFSSYFQPSLSSLE